MYIATLSILLTQPCENKGWADDTSKYDTVQGCSKMDNTEEIKTMYKVVEPTDSGSTVFF